jgi:hypothetical protein
MDRWDLEKRIWDQSYSFPSTSIQIQVQLPQSFLQSYQRLLNQLLDLLFKSGGGMITSTSSVICLKKKNWKVNHEI